MKEEGSQLFNSQVAKANHLSALSAEKKRNSSVDMSDACSICSSICGGIVRPLDDLITSSLSRQ